MAEELTSDRIRKSFVGSHLSRADVRDWFAKLPQTDFAGRRILVVISDSPRQTALPLLFDQLFHQIRSTCMVLDVLLATADRPPLSDPQISKLLGIGETERGRLFYQTQFFNHESDREDRLVQLGKLTSTECNQISGGQLTRDLPVEINSRILDYDLLLVLCEVAADASLGISGGNACFFPGLAGSEVIDFLNQLAKKSLEMAVSNPGPTPCRLAIDALAAMIPQARRAISFVCSPDGSLRGLFYGTPESSFGDAIELHAKLSE